MHLGTDYVEVKEGYLIRVSGMKVDEVPVSAIKKIFYNYVADEYFLAFWEVEVDGYPPLIWHHETKGVREVVSYFDEHLKGFDSAAINKRVREGGIEGDYQIWPTIEYQTVEEESEPGALDVENMSPSKVEKIYDGLRHIRNVRDSSRKIFLPAIMLLIFPCGFLISPFPSLAFALILIIIWYTYLRLHFTACPRCNGFFHKFFGLSHTYFHSTIWDDSNKCKNCGLRMSELPEIKSGKVYRKPQTMFGYEQPVLSARKDFRSQTSSFEHASRGSALNISSGRPSYPNSASGSQRKEAVNKRWLFLKVFLKANLWPMLLLLVLLVGGEYSTGATSLGYKYYVTNLDAETSGIISRSGYKRILRAKSSCNYRYSIEYYYKVQGRIFYNDLFSYRLDCVSSEQEAAGIVDKNPVGKQVTVYYDSSNPQRSVLHRTELDSHVYWGIFLTGGLYLFLFVVFIRHEI